MSTVADASQPLIPWDERRRREAIQRMFANGEREAVSSGLMDQTHHITCIACKRAVQRLSYRRFCYRCQDRLAAMNAEQEVRDAA